MTGVVQDHYLLAWALTHQLGQWEPWGPPWSMPSLPFGEEYGQFRFDGLVYFTRLSKLGVPIVTKCLRQHIVEKIEERRMAGE